MALRYTIAFYLLQFKVSTSKAIPGAICYPICLYLPPLTKIYLGSGETFLQKLS